MAKQTIGIGSAANDGTGSTLRAAFDICNDNFTELYDGSGGLLHKIEGTNFTGSLLVGHSTTGTLDNAFYNVGVGINALDALQNADYTTAVGYNAGSSITSGGQNTLVGALAGDALTSGYSNTVMGYGALSIADTDARNVAIGYRALNILDYDGNGYNVAVGYDAGLSMTSGLRNTLIGAEAGDALTTGIYNVAVGYAALSTEDEHGFNTAIGYGALRSQNAGANGNNVAVGKDAGVNVTTGINNTIIGALSGDALTTGSNNTLIGKNAAASAVDVSNEVTIGDSNISNVRIPSDSTLKIGASGDLQLEHLSSNSFIKNTAVGDLYIENQVDSGDVIFRSDDGSGGLATYFYLNGGDTNINFQKDTLHPDSVKAKFGNSADLNIFHDSSNSYLENKVGNLIFRQEADDADIIFKSDDGSGGDTEYFRLDGGTTSMVASKNIGFIDNIRATFGAGADLAIYHNGTTTNIENINGKLRLIQTEDDGDISFESDDGSGGLETYFFLDGSVGSTKFPNNKKLVFGDSSDLRLLYDGSDAYVQADGTGHLYIQNKNTDRDIIFQSDDGSGGEATYFFLDGSSVTTQFYKTVKLYDAAELYIGDGNDLRLYHNGTNSNIENFVGTLQIIQNLDDGDISFKSDDGSGGTAEYFRIDGGITSILAYKDILMANDGNDGKIKFGASQDLEIFHDGSDNFYNGTTGDMYFINKADDKDIVFQSDDGSGGYTTYFHVDGGTVKSIFSKPVQFIDSTKLFIGSSNDLEIFHDSSNTYLENYTGNFIFTQALDDGDMIFKCDNGSGGATEYFRLDGGEKQTIFSEEAVFADSKRLMFGAGGDLQVQHDGSNSKILNTTGDLKIGVANTLAIQNNAYDENIASFTKDGAVSLYHNNSKKFETTSTGTKTTGQMDIAALNSAPSSASDTGTVGEIRFTADYIYVCVASNTWKRAALSTW